MPMAEQAKDRGSIKVGFRRINEQKRKGNSQGRDPQTLIIRMWREMVVVAVDKLTL